MKYICRQCHKVYEEGCAEWKCSCGGSLWLDREAVVFHRDDIRKDEYTMWRYEKAYPLKKADLVTTLGEGLSPLVQDTWQGTPVYIKNDAVMPTGSFKDRGIVMMVNNMASRGITRITEDSSGNAGASVSIYAARAGIACNIYAPASTSEGKVAQVIAAGAQLHKVPGLRERAAEAAQSGAEGIYASHNWNPYFVEGVKSMAYEIWEQMGFAAPDNVICPAGNGSIVLGLAQGFSELLNSGEISRLPRIFGVQPENCNPLYRQFTGETEPFHAVATVAEGIATEFPSKRGEVMEAIGRSGGELLSVTEDEILAALKQVCAKGYFTEPTSSAAFAGASKLIASGTVKPEEATVIVISGNGLKASEKILQYLRSL